MLLYIFICSWPVFLFCHNVFWKLNSFINENRNAIPREVTCLARVTYSWISIPYKHLFLFHLKIKSMKEICCYLKQIELWTFVSSSSVYWTTSCKFMIFLPQMKGITEQRRDLLAFCANVETDSLTSWMKKFQPKHLLVMAVCLLVFIPLWHWLCPVVITCCLSF